MEQHWFIPAEDLALKHCKQCLYLFALLCDLQFIGSSNQQRLLLSDSNNSLTILDKGTGTSVLCVCRGVTFSRSVSGTRQSPLPIGPPASWRGESLWQGLWWQPPACFADAERSGVSEGRHTQNWEETPSFLVWENNPLISGQTLCVAGLVLPLTTQTHLPKFGDIFMAYKLPLCSFPPAQFIPRNSQHPSWALSSCCKVARRFWSDAISGAERNSALKLRLHPQSKAKVEQSLGGLWTIY